MHYRDPSTRHPPIRASPHAFMGGVTPRQVHLTNASDDSHRSMTLLLGDRDVRDAMDMPALVDHLERSLRVEAETGGMLLPARTNLNHPEGFLRVMPVVMPAAGVLGLKMFHGSLERGVRYVVMVCDLHGGEVLAVVDAAYLTAARTGATSGVATPGPTGLRVGRIDRVGARGGDEPPRRVRSA